METVAPSIETDMRLFVSERVRYEHNDALQCSFFMCAAGILPLRRGFLDGGRRGYKCLR